ncbi:MAG: hypothetical protein J1E04_06045 [Alistipes sp.]|nr:hypothetical protein [Alistipes sp.]
MKFSGFLTVAAFAVIAATPCYGGKKSVAKIKKNDSAKIESYFTAVLNGDRSDYPDKLPVAAKNIAEAERLVWSLWAAANAAFEEDKLPELTPLSDGGAADEKTPSGVWKLGADDMQFFYGSKGDEVPAGGYPLYLCLHGSGDNEREFRVNLSWARYYADAPSVYFIPRSPGGGTQCRWYQPTRQQTWERLLRQAYLSGDIDPDRVYFFGISEGAYGSQRLASFYADYLAGAGPIAGGEQIFWAPPANCAATAFCLQTGEEDTMYGRKLLTEKVAEKWAALQAAHPGYYEHKIDLQPGKGHGCDYTVTTPWLREHMRNPYPKYFYWENLALGNINGEGAAFRRGFYNLYVKERSTDDSDDMVRSCYEMTIEDNTVILNVNVVRHEFEEPVSGGVAPYEWRMVLDSSQSYERAQSGRVVIYLNDSLVDLSRPVRIVVNGREKFRGRLRADVGDMITSCGIFFDPARLYPVSVEVDVD